MTRLAVLVAALTLLACGGDVETHGGGSCPTCSGGGPSIVNVATACAQARQREAQRLASTPRGGTGAGGGGSVNPTITGSAGTPTVVAAPTAAPVVVNVPPSASVISACGGEAVE